MKITFATKLKLNVYCGYFVFSKYCLREDIQKFLNGQHSHDDILNNRINDYLKDIGIYDESFKLTSNGRDVKETGKMMVQEEGVYRVFFVLDDPLLSNRVLYFRRLHPKTSMDYRSPSNIPFPIQSSKEEKHFLLQNKKFDFIYLMRCSPPFIEYEPVEIGFDWTIFVDLDDVENSESHGNFSGKIDEEIIDVDNLDIGINLSILNLIQEIIPTWNNTLKKWKVKFQNDDIELSSNEKESFNKIKQKIDWKNYQVKLENVPLMPIDKDEAVQWRNWLVNQRLDNDYVTHEQFQNIFTEIHKNDGLSSYTLRIPDTYPYTQQILRNANQSKQSRAYWHTIAPYDLKQIMVEQ